jgi:hypothetical protein
VIFSDLRGGFGHLHKARRYELIRTAPCGYLPLPTGEVVLAPDELAKSIVRLVFDKFDELADARHRAFLMGGWMRHSARGRSVFDRVGVAAADQRRPGDDLALAASMSAADDRAFFTSIEPAGRPSLGGSQPGSASAAAPRPSATIMQTVAERRRGRFMGGASSCY